MGLSSIRVITKPYHKFFIAFKVGTAMDVATRLQWITKNTEEVLVEEDLKRMLETGVKLKHYIGFEISGQVHLGTGLMSGMKIADLQKAGVDCSIFLATWHAWMNDKLGGDLETIRMAADYFAENMKASLSVMGGNPDKLRVVNADDQYHNNDNYWLSVVDVAKQMTLARAMRSITIMGRKEGEDLSVAKLLYPAMQVADMFDQGANIAHAGMDQRKAHVIAREVALKLRNRFTHNKKEYKPIALHHPLILGLQKPPIWPIPKEKQHEILSEMKMSKSVKGSAVYVNDEPDIIRQKMKDAFCPANAAEGNPVLDWAKRLVFTREKEILEIKRPEKFGGDAIYESYEKLEADFVNGKMHPMDLKSAMGEKLVVMLEPARKMLNTPKMKKLKEQIENANITR